MTSIKSQALSRAARHHDRDEGTIEIACDSTGENVRFRVIDDGPGIDPDLLSDLREELLVDPDD